jgi:thioredoxin 1
MFRRLDTWSGMEAHASTTSVLIGNIDDATFDREVLSSAVPVLVDFTTAWCGPCRALAPIVHRIAEERAGRLRVVTADGDQCVALAARLRIKGFPTLVLFAGGREIARRVGLTTKDKLLALIDGALSPS